MIRVHVPLSETERYVAYWRNLGLGARVTFTLVDNHIHTLEQLRAMPDWQNIHRVGRVGAGQIRALLGRIGEPPWPKHPR